MSPISPCHKFVALHCSCSLLQVRLKVQAKLGEPITTYNVVEGTKTPPGPGSTADYHIKVVNIRQQFL